MKNKHEVESIEVKLLKMIEQHEITEDDYNLITKYLKKGKNTIKFLPLKSADKEKTTSFWVEIEK